MTGFKSAVTTPDPYLELERRGREIEALKQQNAELLVILDDLLLDLVRITENRLSNQFDILQLLKQNILKGNKNDSHNKT